MVKLERRYAMSEDEKTRGEAPENPVIETDDQELPNQDGQSDSAEVEALKKQLHDTKAELTRVQQARAELERRMSGELAELKGKVDVLLTGAGRQHEQEQPADPLSFLDDESLKEEYLSDPEKAVGALRKTARVLATAIVNLDRKLDSSLSKLAEDLSERWQTVDPEVIEAAESLAQDPELRGLPRKALLAIAKRLAKKPEGHDDRNSAPGRAPGGGRGPSGTVDAYDSRIKELLKRGGW